jgi:prepilin-type N-terminal cleavage/methylation domain-containing protein
MSQKDPSPLETRDNQQIVVRKFPDKKKKQKFLTGFTLIELLVVITIIGILASVVLVQFPGAVSRAKDSRVVSSMSQLRTQALILYTNKEDYTGLYCDIVAKNCSCQDSTVEYLCNDIEANSDQDLVIRINNDNKGFCAVAHLQGSGKYFCVDGNLHAREYKVSPLDNSCSFSCQASNNCSCE